jgi:hypothetical protein
MIRITSRWSRRRAQAVAETVGIAIEALEPGTTVLVRTYHSQYRLVILLEPCVVQVRGGVKFADPAVVRLEGAAAGDDVRRRGWILVGLQMEMWDGTSRIRSSPVRSVSIESVPPLSLRDGRVRA